MRGRCVAECAKLRMPGHALEGPSVVAPCADGSASDVADRSGVGSSTNSALAARRTAAPTITSLVDQTKEQTRGTQNQKREAARKMMVRWLTVFHHVYGHLLLAQDTEALHRLRRQHGPPEDGGAPDAGAGPLQRLHRVGGPVRT
jgi:hypothetical protein